MIVLIISLVYIIKILYLSYLVWGRKYHQIEKSEENPVRNEAESEKEGEDFSKKEKSKSRETRLHISKKRKKATRW